MERHLRATLVLSLMINVVLAAGLAWGVYYAKAGRLRLAGQEEALAGLARRHEEQGNHKMAMAYYQVWLNYEPRSKEAQEGLGKARDALDR